EGRMRGSGVNVAREWLAVAGVNTSRPGGKPRGTAVSLTGRLGAELLSKVHCSVGFFGAKGLTTYQGLTDVNLQEVEMKAAMTAVCERVVAVLDHTKLGQVGLATFAPVSKLALIITDHGADSGIVSELEHAGVEVRLV